MTALTEEVEEPETTTDQPGLRRRVGVLPLVMILFFTVSGGAYTLENTVAKSGPGMALLLIVVTPLIWSLPTVLMVAELSSALPAEGGYYVWVKTALGPFWGFLEGWWSWLNSFVDVAVYPVLFADYLSTLLAEQCNLHTLENSTAHWLMTLALIWLFALLNIRGVKNVADSSKLFFAAIILPFSALSAIGLWRLFAHPAPVWRPFTPPHTSPYAAFGAGLYLVMWNYMGWDNASTIAGEVKQPQRTFPRALALALPLVVLAYLLPIFAGLAIAPDWTQWKENYFVDLGQMGGGRWLSLWIGIGALISNAGLFSAMMLAYSRVPFVLAEDRYLPPVITRLHPKSGAPWVSILLCALIYSLFSRNEFKNLIVVDVSVYTAALMLEFVALFVLRLRRPDLKGGFRVPGGLPVIALLSLLPAFVLALAIQHRFAEQDNGAKALYLTLGALATGPLIYPLARWYQRNLLRSQSEQSSVSGDGIFSDGNDMQKP
jgi:amino acid transporter